MAGIDSGYQWEWQAKVGVGGMIIFSLILQTLPDGQLPQHHGLREEPER